ncbi:MAG: hypothetical protein IPG89_06795 [Bacteroidetes bacterium]|nr:hypothetical protein [Bacteroidota bacterium]
MKKIHLILIVFSISFFLNANAQTYNMGSITSPVVTSSGVFYDSNTLGPYTNNENHTATFCAPIGHYISFVFHDLNIEEYDTLFIYDGSNIQGNLLGAFNGMTEPPTLFSTYEGCLTFKFKSNSTGTNSGWIANVFCTTTLPQPNIATSCSTSFPFCTGTTYNFPNSINVPSLSGSGISSCLPSSPNAVWYHMQILDPGNIEITITQTDFNGASRDVDFILWGPFTSLTNACTSLSSSNVADCSYSPFHVEVADIPNALSSEFYVLLMTNYSNYPGFINFSQTGGSGTADCNILRPITQINAAASICDSVSGTYSVSGQISYQYAPDNGDLIVSTDCGQSVTIPAPWTSPINYTIPGLVADGNTCNISASFTADPTRKLQTTYSSPLPCSPIGLNKNDANTAFSLFLTLLMM